MKSAADRWLSLLPVLSVLAGMTLLIAEAPPLPLLRNALFDQYQRWQPRAAADLPVRIIDIDEESLARLGQWPWPRTRLAELLMKVSSGETAPGEPVAAIAFDILFAEPDRTSPRQAMSFWPLAPQQRGALEALPDHDAVFAQALARVPAVLGFIAAPNDTRQPTVKARFIEQEGAVARWLHGFAGAAPALPVLEAAVRGLGIFNFVPDGDGVVRSVPLAVRVGGQTVPTLTAEALRVATTGQENIVLTSAAGDAGLREVRIGPYRIPVTSRGEVWVHYARPDPARYVPAWKVLDDVDTAARAELAGKIVLVGSSAQGLLDLRFGPFGPLPGVEIHAQALEQILSGQFLVRPVWSRAVEMLTLLLAGIGVGFLALRGRALVAAAICTTTLLALCVAGWWAFTAHGLLLDSLTPALAILLTFFVCSLAHHFASEREQRWIRTAFARYVSPNRVDYLVRHPEAMELGGRRQNCSFIFTDLQGFTTLIEKIPPAQAVALLNAYLDEMIAIVFRHEGTLDRIVGDALVVMFSAPVRQRDHKQRALACALEMDAFASRYAAAQQARGIAFGQTRIGVHAGEVTVGNFGGSAMFDYRALGDPINAAARLESVNKQLGTRMCVSAAVLAASPQVRARPVGQLVLKGKTEALAVFEPLVAERESRYAPQDAYQSAYAALRDKLPDARARFEKLAAAHPDDPLVALHTRRLQAGEQGDLIVLTEK